MRRIVPFILATAVAMIVFFEFDRLFRGHVWMTSVLTIVAIYLFVQSGRGSGEIPSQPRKPIDKSAVYSDHPEMIEEIRGLLRKGNKIEAIKVCRKTLGCGLKEAKEIVEGSLA